MKPFREQVQCEVGESWSRLDRRLADGIPFEWHHHIEYELTLTLNSRGQRFIGDHIGPYEHGDLVLLGPNLPHTWASTENSNNQGEHVALVMWFSPQWADELTSGFSELTRLSGMLSEASQGLFFSQAVRDQLCPKIEALFHMPPDKRLLALVDVLLELSRDQHVEQLASPAVFSSQSAQRIHQRLDRVLEFVHQNYASDTRLADVAEVAALSQSGLHRLFKRHMRTSFSDYVARLRIGKACALLASTNRPIAVIADEVGYRSLANFNRQFKAQKNYTPRNYRQLIAGGT